MPGSLLGAVNTKAPASKALSKQLKETVYKSGSHVTGTPIEVGRESCVLRSSNEMGATSVGSGKTE